MPLPVEGEAEGCDDGKGSIDCWVHPGVVQEIDGGAGGCCGVEQDEQLHRVAGESCAQQCSKAGEAPTEE